MTTKEKILYLIEREESLNFMRLNMTNDKKKHDEIMSALLALSGLKRHIEAIA